MSSGMRVLLADDDPTFSHMVATLLRARTDYEVALAADGATALDLARSAPHPFLLILDWMMPELNGTEICRRVRASSLERQPHVLFVTARSRREEIIECMAAGADDLLTKPVAPDVLLARVQLAAQRWRCSRARLWDVPRALRRAASEGDGELVVRSGDLCARVLFCQGQIAWVHVIDGSGSLLDALAPETGIDAQTAQLVIAECRASGKSLTETLAEWGLVERSLLRDAMKGWVRRKLASICALPEPQVLFLPQRYKGARDLLFDLGEVLDGDEEPSERGSAAALERRPSLIPANGWDAAFQQASKALPAVEVLLARCMEGEGVVAAAILNRTSGVCLGRRGVELDPDIAWAQLQMLNTVMRRERVEDSLVITAGYLHLFTPVPALADSFAYVVVTGERTTVGAARLTLRAAVEPSASS